MEVKVIGQMDNTLDHTFESANRVYDTFGIAPTIPTGCGGGHTPKILEVHKVKESQIVAMRGRNPDDPNSREVGLPTEQRLEVNSENISNCITTVSKDNLVMETSAIRMVRTEEGKKLRKQYESGEIRHGFNEHRKPQLREDGLSNTISTVQKDTLVCETKQIFAIDEQNLTCKTDVFGTLTTDGSSPKHNNRVAEIRIKQATKEGSIPCKIGGYSMGAIPNSKTRRGRVQHEGDVCPTITAQNQELYRIENCECDEPGSVILYMPSTDTYYQVRIRKLTPKECGRLMCVDDADITKMMENNSNTQCYKQFGNSICTDVMVAMFGQLFEGKEEIYKNL